MSARDRKIYTVILVVVVIVIIVAAAGSDTSTSPTVTSADAPGGRAARSSVGGSPRPAPPAATDSPRYTDDSPEFQLALIDDQATSPDDEDAIRPYARELDLLERRCTNARNRLADFTVNLVKRAKASNVSTDNLNVLRNVRRSTPPGWKRQGCLNLYGLYMTVLIDG